MLVYLTHYQARVVMSRIPELHAEAMREHRSVHGPKAHAYDLPAIAWRQIRDHLWLNPAYYGPLGGKLDSQPKALYRAIQLIHQAVLAMEHHPALNDQAVLGRQMQVIPCWQSGSWRKPYAVEDVVPWLFVLRMPRVIELHGMEMTEWVSWTEDRIGPEFGSWTYHREAHEFFMPSGVVPLVGCESPD